jgi:DNA anti-recombination protein RmuC
LNYLINLLLHAFVIFILFVSYITLERAYRTRSRPTSEESKDVKDFVVPSPQINQFHKDVDRAKNIGAGALLIFQELKDRQQDLKVDVEEVWASISEIQESVRSIDDQTRRSANNLDLQESVKSINDQTRRLANIPNLQESIKTIEEQTQRFANILLGPQAKGALGEKILKQQLAQLPHEWIDLNPPYPGGQKVEYALRVPDSRIIPIDSKWTGTEQMDRLGQTTDTEEQNKWKERIAMGVVRRSLEVRKYLDKDRTLGFCIVAVPDAVFEISWGKQAELLAFDIVLVSYSLLIPYILIIVKLFWSSAQSIQSLQLSHVLNSSMARVQQLQELIDNDMRLPLKAFDQQQAEYVQHTEQLKEVVDRLSEISKDLSAIQNSRPVIDPLTKLRMSSMSATLKDKAAGIGDALRDVLQNEPSDTNPET